MRIRQQQETTESPDMTPMLDIVFIMLIFFIVTTSFVKESGVEWRSMTNSDKKTGEKKPLLVTIDEMNIVSIQGRIIESGAITANVSAALIDNNISGAIIRSHGKVPSGILVNAVDQIRLAGVSQVSVGKLISD